MMIATNDKTYLTTEAATVANVNHNCEGIRSIDLNKIDDWNPASTIESARTKSSSYVEGEATMATTTENAKMEDFKMFTGDAMTDDSMTTNDMDISDIGSSMFEEEDFNLSRLYGSDVEIDRSDEEQTITEMVQASGQGDLAVTTSNNSMRVAFGIILRLVLPLANGVVRGIKGIRDARFLRVLRSIASSRQAFTNLVAFAANTISMNLSSVQVSYRIDPILKLMKIRKSRDGVESLPDIVSIDGMSQSAPVTPCTPPPSPTTPFARYSPSVREPNGPFPQFTQNRRPSKAPEELAPNCCTLNILAEPPLGQPIRADIVFIHGLHGSQANTWKQGLWENERQPVGFERPPKPPVRPPKRPRHSRSALIRPPHKQKRARFAHSECQKHSHDDITQDNGNANDFSFICGEPTETQVCEGVEYSFPTFRLRMNDNGRLLQAEFESMLDGSGNSDKQKQSTSGSDKKKTKAKGSPKPSANDPNYSKCWPGDWLPLDCPGVRVIALNYTTDQYLWRPLWKKKEPRTSLIQRSREMAELLIKYRVGYGHPVVWVGHSKGGLFVKQIIVDAWESGRPAMAPFWRSARGVFFYSVPHRGSHLASIKAPLLTRSVELLDIEKNNKYLIDLHRRFVGLYHLGHLKIEVFSFVETALTLMSVLYLRIVGVDSADPGIGDVCGIRLDHREICKPRSRECILYKELVKMINKVC